MNAPAPPRRPHALGRALAAAASASIAALVLPLTACSSDPPILTVEIVTGHETDTFSQAPPVTRVDITARAAEGDLVLEASAPPGGTFDFGEVPSDRLLAFEVTGIDTLGAPAVRGRSLGGIYLAAVAGGVIPVFAQRVNRWSRPPGALLHAHIGAPAATLGERYIVTSGGTSALDETGEADPGLIEFYDLFAYGGATAAKLPRTPRSLVARASALLLIDDAGATVIDFNSGLFNDIAAPAGLATFADVASGSTVEAPDGRSFVIGATRATGATKTVLTVAANGSLSVLSLKTPRAGAAAAWVPDVGLVVAGGSAEGAGVEVLAPGATAFAERDFPPDSIEGAAAVVVDPETLTLLGGVLEGAPAPTRLLDLRCSKACTAEPSADASLPLALTGVAAYALGGGRIIAVGEETAAGGLTRAFLVDTATPGAVEAPLREPRRGASVTPAPNGTLALVGGVHPDGSPALTVELLFPQ